MLGGDGETSPEETDGRSFVANLCSQGSSPPYQKVSIDYRMTEKCPQQCATKTLLSISSERMAERSMNYWEAGERI